MRKNILIVDDDQELTEGLSDLLQSEGYQVDVASDGFQGEACLKSCCYDVMLLDFKMPGLTGAEMLQRVKSCLGKTKVIFISGRPGVEKEIQKDGLLSLVSDFVNKPFNIDVLLGKIAAC